MRPLHLNSKNLNTLVDIPQRIHQHLQIVITWKTSNCFSKDWSEAKLQLSSLLQFIEQLSPNEEEQETKSVEVSSKKDTANTEDNTKLEVKIKNGQYETVTDKLESFNCPVCKEAFKTKKDMLKHEKINHTEHECKTCKLLFKNAVDLNAHITQEHVLNETLRHTRSRNKRKLVHKDEQNQNSKICLPSTPNNNNITWSADPWVPPVWQEPLVSNLPADVLLIETCKQKVLKYFSTVVLDLSITAACDCVRGQSDPTCNCLNFPFFKRINFALFNSEQNICTAQSEISSFIKSMKKVVKMLTFSGNLIMCIFLFTDSSLPRIL